MKAFLLWTTLPAILFLAISVNGASFDCAKGSSFAEMTICKERMLSELDDQLALAYKNALTNSAEPSAVRTSQIDWLRLIRNRCQDSECLRGAYAARLTELDRATHFSSSLPQHQSGELGRGNVLSSHQILNGTFFSFDAGGRKLPGLINLRDGEWSDKSDSSFLWIYGGDKKIITFGDINGDGAGDAAVILVWSGGGSGRFASVAAVLNLNGKPVHVASRELGDRVEIKRALFRSVWKSA